MTMQMSSSMRAAAPMTSSTVSNTCRLNPLWMPWAAPEKISDTLEPLEVVEASLPSLALRAALAASPSPMAERNSASMSPAMVTMRVSASLFTRSPFTAPDRYWAKTRQAPCRGTAESSAMVQPSLTHIWLR